ncbi:MAG TPA: hypothetical protein VIV63_06700, partial [Steroidobacteraceae bacterium]
SGLRSSLSALTKPYEGGMWCFFKTLMVSRAKSDCRLPSGSVPLSGRSSKVSATLSFDSAAATEQNSASAATSRNFRCGPFC